MRDPLGVVFGAQMAAQCGTWVSATMPRAGGLRSQRGKAIRGWHHRLVPRETAVKAKMWESAAPVESGRRSDSQEGQLRSHRERPLVSLYQAQLGGPDLGAQRSWGGGSGMC